MRPLTSLKNMRQVRGPSTRLGSQIRLESVQSQRDSVATAKLPPCAPIRGCGATETWTAGYGRRGDDGRRARGEHGGRSGRDGAVDARSGAGACRWGGGGGRTRAGGRRGNETSGLREGDGRRGGGGGRAGRLDGRYEAVRVGRVREGCVGKGWSAGKETDAAHTGESDSRCWATVGAMLRSCGECPTRGQPAQSTTEARDPANCACERCETDSSSFVPRSRVLVRGTG
jgi:hypothetical protein